MDNKKITVGYISPVNPEKDRMSWSGTYYNTFHAIKNTGVNVKWLSYNADSLNFKIQTKLANIIYKLRYGQGSSTHSRLMSKIHVRFLDNKELNDCDVIFAPGQIDMLAKLNTKKPIIYYTDGTFKVMVNYYWFGFSDKAIKEGNITEDLATSKATYNFRASKWAANSSIKDYHAERKDTYVFPFGADVPNNHDFASIPDYSSKTLKLLFSGKDWKRKGGNIAVEAVEYLNSVGINTKLYIVGVSNIPENLKNKDFIELVGYIDKNTPDGYNKYLRLYHECNAFILPTRAECAGLVFAEANAYAMPIFSTETGGVGDYVVNGVNGYRLPLSASGRDFGKCIEDAYKDKKFDDLSRGALELYKTSTSWDAWSENFKKFLEKVF
ncbi:glycosyltransferase involved in cell wall biosynthesis [Lactobacillus colini]|uniref:Glycosyltransferase involved in cell wall biosynthesis n=1 Tax=Lactobacillus colini TaxID=1819254 RepID=A0ABS4MEJ6_9LACO|nr:glycosyltransferase family 4 protein [Lactobacillus colini]MBP2058101.1 glycosyltransferase involved in cell wall biosynthesis [Lactobacillus colini]